MTDRINDMELMKKILMFTRKNRPGMRGEGHGFHHGKGEPHFGRGPMPPFEGPHHGERPPIEGPEPHCFKRPPLSREHLLVLISEKPEGIRQKELMEKAGIGQSSVSELINKLEDDGYIERKVDPSDKRATLLFLTEKGQARALEVEDERNEFFSGIFSKLTDDEKQTLSDIMDKLLDD